MNVEALVAWLVDGAPGAATSSEVFGRYCDELAAAGVPLDRAEAFVRTLHPHVVGRSFLWRPGREVEVRERTYEYLQSPEFLASPVARTFRTGEYVRVRLRESGALPDASVRDLLDEGLSDFLVAPLRFRSGEVHGITLATASVGGFRDEVIATIRSTIPALARVAEILALTRTAENLLSTYVGHDAGERILAGKIRRGDVDSIRAVIWFSDLRGFTSMAGELPPGEVVRALNELFECQVAAIERRGGEVLKFIGDGLFAIFRVDEEQRSPRKQCEIALACAKEAFANLDALNARRAARGERQLHVGLALHLGEVAYGNIGGARRLDFTCIGPAVNLAARMEGVASKLGRDLVLSDEFRSHAPIDVELLGEFELKGISTPQKVYGLR